MFAWTESANRMPPSRGPRNWLRVSPRRLCAICQKGDWCSYTEDGSEACCMRVADGAYRNADLDHGQGHYHRLSGDRRAEAVDYSTVPRSESAPRFDLDFAAVLGRWSASTAPWDVDELAISLGCAFISLTRLGVVYSARHMAWAFPMYDARRRIIGIRLRSTQAVNDKYRKFSLTGSRPGLFMPMGIDSRSTLLICEGPTDTAAAITLGFTAIGRPSCTGGVSIMCEMLSVGRRRDVVIVADNDARGEGIFGANRLADAITDVAASVRVIDCSPHKDLREWLQYGGTSLGVNHRINSTSPRITDGLDKSRNSNV